MESSQAKKGRTWIDQTQSSELSCFERIIKEIESDHQASQKTQTWEELTPHLWAKLLNLVGRSPGTGNEAVYESNKQYINCTGGYQSPRRDKHNAHKMIGGGQTPGSKGTLTPGCQTGTLYLNDKCELQPMHSVDEASKRNNPGGQCTLSLRAEVATPLSLIWSSAYKSEPSTIVAFKLDPTSKRTSWMWRGSESLPLLVFDPEGTGIITSAEQLFGPWTFGGKAVQQRDAQSTWRDGYEALASLDTDNDGKISDSELAPLSLWFDKNRDGISQAGEVVRVTKLGISSLYFQPDRSERGAPLATRGYERVVKGRIVQGRSIDWSEHAVTTQSELFSGGFDPDNQARARLNDSYDQKPFISSLVDQRLLGSWVWTIDGQEDGSGLLAFSADEDGVSGATINPLGVRNLDGVQAQISFSHFVVSVSKDHMGLTHVTFTAKGVSGALLTNSALLFTDGNIMSGKTVVEGSNLAKSGSYEYSWTARKLS